MRLIIAGGRGYALSALDYAWLDRAFGDQIVEVVSGCCSGADSCGEFWAITRRKALAQFPARWREHGRSAGPIRNAEMARYAAASPDGRGACVLFPGGRGTEDMARKARDAGLEVFDRRGLS